MTSDTSQDAITDRLTNVVLDHATDLAKEVVVPTAKFALLGAFARYRRVLIITTLVGSAVVAAAGYWRRRSNDTDRPSSANVRSEPASATRAHDEPPQFGGTPTPRPSQTQSA